MRTEYGTEFKEIAMFILGHCGMSIASECDEETHVEIISEALKNTPKELLYYLSDATENNKLLLKKGN